LRTVDDHLEAGLTALCLDSLQRSKHQLGQIARECAFEAHTVAELWIGEIFRRLLEAAHGRPSDLLSAAPDQKCALYEFARYVLSGLDALLQFFAPGAEGVWPRFDGELPESNLVHFERAEPAIRVELVAQWRLTKRTATLGPIEQSSSDQVVTILVDVRLDENSIAHDALDWERSLVDRRRHVFDDQSGRLVGRSRSQRAALQLRGQPGEELQGL
jgi:hypothetical protein